MHPLLMDLDDVAALSTEHPATVGARARRGEIPGTQIGVQWRFWRPTVMRAVVGETAAAHALRGLEQPEDPEVVNPSQLADLLGISLPTILNLVSAGAIPAGKTGSRWHIYWPAIRDAIAEGRPLAGEKGS